MKIEKVIFENINSLGGHFEVDFTHPSLSDGGIFVISGPTGVGKTSLLDAISFALYGRTARQGGVSNNENELMTRGTLHCMAEVHFEKGGQRYVARSYQRRRRGRSEDAAPFATVERGLFNMTEDGMLTPRGDQKVHSVDKGVEKIMGLNYDNFQRCMMLAQGEFAKFLHADPKDRSQVLATITGTKIYQRIGEIVYDHKAALERELQSQQSREVMSPEAREAAEAKRDAAARALKDLDARVESLAEAAAWLKALADAVESCSQARQRLAAVQEAQAEFERSGRMEDWRQAEAAQAVAPAFAAHEAARTALESCRRSIATESGFLQNHAPALQAAEAAEQTAQTQLAAQEPELLDKLTHLREVIRPQEQAAALARRTAEGAARTAATAQKRVQDARTALDASLARETKARQAENEARAARQAVQADAVLAQYLPSLETRFKDWRTATRKAGLPEDTAPEPTADLLRSQEGLKAQREAVLAGGSRGTLLARKDGLLLLQERQNAVLQAEAAAAKAQSRMAEAQAALAALTPLEPVQQLVESLTSARDSLQTCSSLEDQLAKLCRDFQEGTLPSCPCCGSTVPPEQPPRPLSAQLLVAEQSLKDAKARFQKLQREHDKAQRALSQAQGQAAGCADALQKALDAQASALEGLGMDSLPADLPERIAQVSADLQKLEETEDALAALTVRLALAEKRDAFLQELAPCCPDTPAHVAAAGVALKALAARRKAFDTLEAALRQASEAAALATQQAGNDTTAHQNAEQAATQAQADASSAENTAKALEDKLLAERGPEPSATTEKRLQAQADALRKAYNTAHDTAEKERAVQAQHAPLLQQAQEKEPGLIQAADEALAAFRQSLADHALADDAAFQAARAKLPALAALRLEREQLAQDIAAAQSSVKLTQEQVQTLQARNLTSLSVEELEKERQGVEYLRAAQNELHVQTLTALITDDDARLFNSRLEAELDGKRRELDEWTALAEILLVRTAKDGFKRYAQRITFNILIRHANLQLRTLNDRFTLEQGESELSLYVRDRYQDDEARSCSNLSGGESFVVSLALALGLSRMSGDSSIDSLFLDEGFGTLDENTLTHVLDCLQTLRADGKQVGIISHVQRLKNEIRASLELVPREIKGLSTFAPHPAVIAQAGDTIAPTAAAQRQADNLARLQQAVLDALAAGPSREKELRQATGIANGLRNLLRAMAAQGLISFDGKLYALP